MFTHMLGTIPHIRLTSLSVEGITEETQAVLPSQPGMVRGLEWGWFL